MVRTIMRQSGGHSPCSFDQSVASSAVERPLNRGACRILLSVTAMLLVLMSGRFSQAQSTEHISWLDRATKTRSAQPDWVTPLITASANLEEATIYDTSRKIQANGTELVTAGGPRGVQFVPFGKVQLTLGATPYLAHNDPKVRDGFGDTSFAVKYRFASGNAAHGNYAFSGLINESVPTGSYQNGQKSGIVTSVLLGEKGWGNFNIQSTYGLSLPLGNTRTIGRQYSSNTAFQYRFGQLFYPELEANVITYKGGQYNGQTQLYLLPGLLVGRFPIASSAGLTCGLGMQIAATHDRAYNHNLVFSIRFPLQSHHFRGPNPSPLGR